MDGPLKSNQGDITFQMKALLSKNTEFLKMHMNHVNQDRLEAAENRTRELLRESVKARKDEDMDSEMEDLMEAHSIEEEKE